MAQKRSPEICLKLIYIGICKLATSLLTPAVVIFDPRAIILTNVVYVQ